jgi:hypothetical protein
MALEVSEVISITLLALVGGMYWGPWLALTRSMATFEPDVFLPIVDRMSRNMAAVMTVLVPMALVSTVPVLVLSYGAHPSTFWLTAAALALFVLTLVVTVQVEVPIVRQIETWTVSTLPDDWRQLRDRWGSFHLLRVGPAIVGLVLLLVGAIFSSA